MGERLENAQSPYLQRNRESPVEWYEWGEEPFRRAKEEEKLIFLSIGYSSCHWCHVMEREVFENREVADLLNREFISIKVDREERPDIDRYYQEVYRLLNQQSGGWPLSIFMTPDRKPFFAATYIPLEPRDGRVGFKELIENMVRLFKRAPREIYDQADQIVQFMKPATKVEEMVPLDRNIGEHFLEAARRFFDPINGGFGSKPKFPHTSIINTLLTIYRLEGREEALQMATKTLREMARGGLRDIVDGGFCRYTTDEEWSIPHFEKMTYDNALLMESYLRAYHTTRDPFFRGIALEIAEFMMEYMEEKGLFFSASDADSQGVEGGYFTYDYREVVEKLKRDGFGEEEIEAVLERLNIKREGAIGGRSLPRTEEPLSSTDEEPVLKSLKEIRKNRPYPFIDKKIITSWNAMMIRSLYIAARMDNRYFEVAEESMEALLKLMLVDDHLYHSTIIGERPKIKGFLEDYAYLAIALLEGYKTTLKEEYLAKAQLLVEDSLVEFFDGGRWQFSKGEFCTEADYNDSSYPSSAAVMVDALLTLGALRESRYFDFAFDTLRAYSGQIEKFMPWCGRFVEETLRYLHQDRVIASTPENLAPCTLQIDLVRYPFTLLKGEEHGSYLLCDRESCRKESESCQEILRSLDG
ncbi:MAG: thioredoxin domain-containing protein [Epsilonproteobacteria bacterium]|nr:thioredoxin domain-containing protein [Campylobacterota bacterium]NPA57078.1 thioredoxin domain-containing protein [Campylobacterota bacterium]